MKDPSRDPNIMTPKEASTFLLISRASTRRVVPGNLDARLPGPQTFALHLKSWTLNRLNPRPSPETLNP